MHLVGHEVYICFIWWTERCLTGIIWQVVENLTQPRMTMMYPKSVVFALPLLVLPLVLVIQWQDGEIEVVWPDDVATAAPRYPTPALSDGLKVGEL